MHSVNKMNKDETKYIVSVRVQWIFYSFFFLYLEYANAILDVNYRPATHFGSEAPRLFLWFESLTSKPLLVSSIITDFPSTF